MAGDARGRRGRLLTRAAARVRRAGSGLTAEGDRVTWAVATGQRGRRWRESLVRDGHVRHSMLLETDPSGRFSHLELTTPTFLLTLHPEADGTLHGNRVSADGVEHVVGWPWAPDGVIDLAGSAITGAAAVSLLGRSLDPAGSVACRRLHIDPETGPALADAVLELARDGTWRFSDGSPFRVDDDGLPLLESSGEWPLDAGPAG